MPARLPEESPQDARDVMAAPFRAIAATIVFALLLGAVLNLAAGRPITGSASLLGVAAAGFAWWWNARGGSLQTSASIAFYSLAFTLTVFMWVGQGTRDYGLAGYPAVLFLGCVFLARYAYWGLAALVLAAITALGVAELTDLRPVTFGPPPELRNLINLWVIIGASAIGGRVLMRAVRSSMLRERSLSGALQSSEDRMQKILRSSQNAIVVSRFSDGTYLEVNDAFVNIFGYRRDEVIGRTSVELGVWEDIAERERFISLLRDGHPVRDFDTRQRKKSGEVIELLLSAEPFDMEGDARLMITATDITARRTAERRAEFLSTRDALTGLPNRAVAMDRLQQALERARRAGESVAVLHVDLDRFKAVNDSVGRRWGDELLRESRTRLELLMHQGDTLARIGGNEFLVIAHVRLASDVEQLAASVVAAFEPPFTVEGRALRITCSVGASVYPDDSSDAESLLLYADTAMYEAKSGGRARHCLYAQVMSERVRDRLLVENSLRESIGSNDLRLVYQPKFDMNSRAITGVEALARWTHPKLGSVPPAQFIAIAEESDLICELGHWVLKESCAQIASWREQGLPALPVAVNLSARQITPELPAQLFACARERGVAPGMLELEVTETMLISQPDASRKVLEQVTRNGNSIVLDDFGVGYSSLGYVKLLHLNGIKIDRSFVGDVVQSRHDKAIVSAIVGLAHGLGFRVVAEGIESEDQLQVLRQLGCDEAQGFHLSRPLSGEQLATDFLARGTGMHWAPQ